MTTFIQRLEQVIANDWQALKTFFSGEVWPALENFFESTLEEEVKALIPILEKKLPEVILDVGMLFSPSGWAAGVSALIGTAEATIQEMATAGKQVAAESIHTAVGAVLANAKAVFVAQPSGSQSGAPIPADPTPAPGG